MLIGQALRENQVSSLKRGQAPNPTDRAAKNVVEKKLYV
jgi:hypothetical protein